MSSHFPSRAWSLIAERCLVARDGNDGAAVIADNLCDWMLALWSAGAWNALQVGANAANAWYHVERHAPHRDLLKRALSERTTMEMYHLREEFSHHVLPVFPKIELRCDVRWIVPSTISIRFFGDDSSRTWAEMSLAKVAQRLPGR